MRVSILFAAALLVSVGCATAVIPDGSEAETKAVGDAGDQSSDNSYAGSGDGGAPTSDGGKTTPPKGDSGTPISGGSCTFSGVLATFDFSSESGDQTSTAATSKAAGITAGDVKRASTLTPVSGSGSINASGWTTSTHVDMSRYYTLTLTPPSGCSLDLTSLSVDSQSSGAGPGSGAVATSDDSFSAKTNFATNATHSAALSVSGSSGAVEVRIYGFGASSTSGTMRIENTLTVSGALH